MAISTQWEVTVSSLAVVWCSRSLQFIDMLRVICNSTNVSFKIIKPSVQQREKALVTKKLREKFRS